MSSLLVYSYFCPAERHRPGGVQQVVPPLLTRLRDAHGWDVRVVHWGDCGIPEHSNVDTDYLSGDGSESSASLSFGRGCEFASIASDFDVVLSIDRRFPFFVDGRVVLMANTAAYETELAGIVAHQDSTIVVPSECFKTEVQIVAPDADIVVIPYGIEGERLRSLESLKSSSPNYEDVIIRLPHRPDPRKGHRATLRGVARLRRLGVAASLELSWLDEQRYEPFRLELTQYADDLQILDHVSFLPWINDHVEYSERIKKSSLTVQVGSFVETFGLALIETVLAGRLLITGLQPATREVIRECDLWTELENASEWEMKAYKLLRNRSWQSGRHSNIPFDFSIDRMSDQYNRVLRRCLESA